MSKAKELRRQRADQLGRQKALHDAVLVERNGCATICENYAALASRDGLIVHPQIARELADAIRREPT